MTATIITLSDLAEIEALAYRCAKSLAEKPSDWAKSVRVTLKIFQDNRHRWRLELYTTDSETEEPLFESSSLPWEGEEEVQMIGKAIGFRLAGLVIPITNGGLAYYDDKKRTLGFSFDLVTAQWIKDEEELRTPF